MESSLATLDRVIFDLTRLARHHHRELRSGTIDASGPFVDVPFVTERRWFAELSERAELQPVREALLSHSFRLTDARVNAAATAALAQAYRDATHDIEIPETRSITVRELLHTMLAAPHRSAAWWNTFALTGATLTEAVLGLYERRVELARRAGLEHIDSVESPTEELTRLAARALDATAPWLRELLPLSPEAYFCCSLGMDARDDWPARQTTRAAIELLGMPALLEGLSLDLHRFPKALGPASFLRGQLRLGAAIAAAAAARESLFIVQNTAHRLTPLCFGALLGLTPLSDTWQTRRMGVTSPSRRAIRRRALQGIRLLTLRHLALSVLLRDRLLQGRERARTEGRALLEEHLGPWLPRAPLGLFPRISPETPARFVALLVATLEHQKLVHAFDTDWFDNPRAARELRHELSAPPQLRVPTERLERALDLTLKELAEGLF
jgi:hypothetical protein